MTQDAPTVEAGDLNEVEGGMQAMRVSAEGGASPPHVDAASTSVDSEEERALLKGITDGHMSEGAIRDRVAQKLTSGFAEIEQMHGGTGGDDEFQREWQEHMAKVAEFFRTHNPSDPDFEEKRKQLVSDFKDKAATMPGTSDSAAAAAPDR